MSVKRFNQRIGVSGMAPAFRIISRFRLNRIWLEKLNQLCPGITEMTLEGSLGSTGQSVAGFHLQLQWCRETLGALLFLFNIFNKKQKSSIFRLLRVCFGLLSQ